MPLRTKTSPKALRRAAAASLAMGLSLSLSGCGLLTAGATPAPSTVHLSGSVLANAMPLQIPMGGYRTITLNREAAVANYDDSKFNQEMMTSQGYSTQAGIDGQVFAATFMAEQFLDSTALEGDMSAFQTWYDTTGANLIDSRAAANATDASSFLLVLGNYGKKRFFPEMVHDGQPRVSSAELSLVEAGPYFAEDGSKLPGIAYVMDFKADYRTTDAGASALAGYLTGMSAEDFIKSDMAKPSLKDGSGENIYHVEGRVSMVVNQAPDGGGWKIVGFGRDKLTAETNDFTEKNFEDKVAAAGVL